MIVLVRDRLSRHVLNVVRRDHRAFGLNGGGSRNSAFFAAAARDELKLLKNDIRADLRLAISIEPRAE